MKGKDIYLTQFIDGARNRFIIPVYQRNYDWKRDNCAQLFNDLVRLSKSGKESHFFGSIVSSSANNGNRDDFLIIDWQQRLTTVTLLLAAAVNLLKKDIIISKEWSLSWRIEETFLIDKYNQGERKMRLKPIKNDCTAFDSIIIGNEDKFDHKSNVTANYLYFYDRIQEGEITVDELCDAVEKLKIIDIFLEKSDDPQSIFESLNSTGLDLEEADKIRNYVLMDLSSDLQEEYYEKYWNPIEELTDYKVSQFVRDYLAVKLGRIPNINKVYVTFKEFVENPADAHDVTGVLEEMLSYSKIYSNIMKQEWDLRVISPVLKRLNHLEFTVVNPFLLAYMKYANENWELPNQIANIILIIEAYLFRRHVCGYPTNVLNQIFCTLHKDVLRLNKSGNPYSDVLTYILESKSGNSKFPDDFEFQQALTTRNAYSFPSRYKTYLFERFENADSLERVDVIERMKDGILTIEHIMPQTLTDQWKKDLGPDFQSIYDTWLNTLANLTLTGYNSTYRNRPFRDKRDTQNGFKDTNLRLSSYVSKCENWTLDELKHRSQSLCEQALNLWKYPTSSFVPDIQLPESHSLDEEYSFTHRSVIWFVFQGTQQKVVSWKEALLEITKTVFERDPSHMYRLMETDHIDFQTVEDNWNDKISEGLYIATSSSTQAKIRILKKIFAHYGIEETELEFLIAPTNLVENSEMKEES